MAYNLFYRALVKAGKATEEEYVSVPKLEAGIFNNHSGKDEDIELMAYRMPTVVPTKLTDGSFESMMRINHSNIKSYAPLEKRYGKLLAAYARPKPNEDRQPLAPFLSETDWVNCEWFKGSICFVGSIGVGKTSFIKRVLGAVEGPILFKYEVVLEVCDGPEGDIVVCPDFDWYINEYLKDSDLASFPFHSIIFYRQLLSTLYHFFKQASRPFVVVFDRFFWDSVFFYAQYNSADEQYEQTVQSFVTSSVAKNVLGALYPWVTYVCMAHPKSKQNLEEILCRIGKRGRPFEQALQDVDIKAYYSWIPLCYSSQLLPPSFLVPIVTSKESEKDYAYPVALMIKAQLQDKVGQFAVPRHIIKPVLLSYTSFVEFCIMYGKLPFCEAYDFIPSINP